MLFDYLKSFIQPVVNFFYPPEGRVLPRVVIEPQTVRPKFTALRKRIEQDIKSTILSTGEDFHKIWLRGISAPYNTKQLENIRGLVDSFLNKHGVLYVEYTVNGKDKQIRTIYNHGAVDTFMAIMCRGYVETFGTNDYSDKMVTSELSQVKSFKVYTPDEWNLLNVDRDEDVVLKIELMKEGLRLSKTEAAKSQYRKEIEKLTKKIRKTRSGAYFPYLVKKEYYDATMSEFQIYPEGSTENSTHCVLFSLRKLNLIHSDSIVKIIQDNTCFLRDNAEIKFADITKLLNTVDIPFLHFVTVDDKFVKRYHGYNKEGRFNLKRADLDWSITLCLIKNHFFAPGTMNSVDMVIDLVRNASEKLIPYKGGYCTLKQTIADIHDIKDEDGIRRQQEQLDHAKEMIKSGQAAGKEKELIEKKIKDEEVFSVPVPEYTVPEYADPEDKRPLVFACDTETYPMEDGISHAFMVTLRSTNINDTENIVGKIQKVWKGDECVKKCVYFLQELQTAYDTSIQIWFFNLKFDLSMFLKHFSFQKTIIQGETLYGATMLRKIGKKTFKLDFRDFAKIHSGSLDMVAKSLGVAGKQQGINYTWHTPERIVNRQTCSLEEYLPPFVEVQGSAEYIARVNNLQERNRKKMQDTLIESGFYRDGVLHASEMYENYCVEDGRVLAECMEKTDVALKALSKNTIGLADARTAAGFAYKLVGPGMDGVHFPIGYLRRYINKFLVGGRVCANQHFVRKVINSSVLILDVNSLYPSAIVRMKTEYGGFPAGRAIPCKEEPKKGFYLARVKIISVGRRLRMPFIRVKTGDVIKYTNDPDPNEVIWSNSIELEDWKRWHEIRYEFLGGVYYTKVGASEFCDQTAELFELKAKYKREGNDAMCTLVKLILNSSYGKTGQKSVYNSTRLIDNDELERLFRRGSAFEKAERVSPTQSLVTTLNPDDKMCMPNIIAITCTAMSRRIMNEIMGVLQVYCKGEVFYTDTDSIHIEESMAEPLRAMCLKVLGRDIIGDGLSQMHNDIGVEHKIDVVGTQALYCGSKCYFIRATGKNKAGEVVADQSVVKLKGVTKNGLIDGCMKMEGACEADRYLKLYETFCGTGFDMVLNPVGFGKIMMAYRDFGSVYNRKEGDFRRMIKFSENISSVEDDTVGREDEQS